MKRFILGVAALVLLWGGAGQAAAGGGAVLPATARPSGYTLEDMAEELAYFSTSGNDLTYYPDTPFQILYTGPTNTFSVPTGTRSPAHRICPCRLSRQGCKPTPRVRVGRGGGRPFVSPVPFLFPNQGD